ncbi:regulator of telomere elongation helicase 1 [Pelomyxa schiedti]|nr:regulator of telomere elongation helicase 1 [Pelomyxa schiedti]
MAGANTCRGRKYVLCGVSVDFPYEAYPCQLVYMEKVIQALNNRQNALLESPTGTGKTLCLLCSALSWQREQLLVKLQYNWVDSQVMKAVQEDEEEDEEKVAADTASAKSVATALVKSVVDNSSCKNSSEEVGHTTVVPSSGSVGLKNSMGDSGNDDSTLVFDVFHDDVCLDTHVDSVQSSSSDHTQQSEETEEEKPPRPPKIIYTSRTHSQLTQVIKEFRRSSYQVSNGLLGARSQLCLEPAVRKLPATAQNQACNARTSRNECKLRNNLSDKQVEHPKDFLELLRATVDDKVAWDIEDLEKVGRENNICPYYLSRETIQKADVLFMPYNYLIDPKIRATQAIDWTDSVVIFDEAHNLDSVCQDAISVELTPEDLNGCLRELDDCIEVLKQNTIPTENNPPLVDFFHLKDIIAAIQTQISALYTAVRSGAPLDVNPRPTISTDGDNYRCATFVGSYFRNLLEKSGIAGDQGDTIVSILSTAVQSLQDAGSQHAHLDHFSEALKLSFFVEPKDADRYLKVHIFTQKSQWCLGYWCFSPALALRSLLGTGIRCMILTSGTLSPLDALEQELGVPFPIKLENSHVVPLENVWGCIVSSGTRKIVPLNSGYQNRSSAAYQMEVGDIIAGVSRVTPGGVLVFFPSYYMLTSCITLWSQERNGACIMNLIKQYKTVVTEPRNMTQFNAVIQQYNDEVAQPTNRGAIFLAVARGKVSEGIDFSDHHARAVVVVGLPFPNLQDAKVKLKRQYMDEAPPNPECKPLSGEDWYTQQATRAVNQAIGRVIRHIADFGAILLCDERFSRPKLREALSRWLRPCLQSFQTWGDTLSNLTKFFNMHHTKYLSVVAPGAVTAPPAIIPLTNPKSPAKKISPTPMSVQYLKSPNHPPAKPSTKMETSSVTSPLKTELICRTSASSVFRGHSNPAVALQNKHLDTNQPQSTPQHPKLQAQMQPQPRAQIPPAPASPQQPNRQVAIADSPTKGRSSNSSTFLVQVKAVLSVENYTIFTEKLNQFKQETKSKSSSKISKRALAILREAEVLLEGHPGLVSEFLMFVPANLRGHLSPIKATKPTTEPNPQPQTTTPPTSTTTTTTTTSGITTTSTTAGSGSPTETPPKQKHTTSDKETIQENQPNLIQEALPLKRSPSPVNDNPAATASPSKKQRMGL